MIYISSSCVKQKSIKEAVLELVSYGFKNIELSGGTDYYPQITDDLCELKEKHNLNYLIHNYFPPPPSPFIFNIGSLKKEIHSASVAHAKRAINMARILGAAKYGIHAGFFFDPDLKQIGKRMDRTELKERKKVIDLFCKTYSELKSYADEIPLYIENNVLSLSNYESFGKNNPFMLTDYEGYKELCNEISFPMILDLAHLFVSCNTLGLNFEEEVKQFSTHSDYIHISDNDGTSDANKGLNNNSILSNTLQNMNLKGKTLTLEIYEKPEVINRAVNFLEEIV
jgi:sugar phosphate isomerase/epimerase